MMSMLNVARVTRVGNVVVNVEVATQEWLDSVKDDPWFLFVTYDDHLKDNGSVGKPFIGLRYDPETKSFEQPPEPPSFPEMTPELMEEAIRLSKDHQTEVAEAEEIVKEAKKRVRKQRDSS
jgi:hypothetical protein